MRRLGKLALALVACLAFAVVAPLYFAERRIDDAFTIATVVSAAPRDMQIVVVPVRLSSTPDLTLTRAVVYPHLGADPVVAASQIVLAAQTVASRSVSPLDSVVVTFGTFHAGSATNVIPERAALTGTLRTLRAETRTLAKARLQEIVESTARALGCRGELEVREGYPVTANDETEAERVLEVAREAVFARGAVEVPEPGMGGEDFAYYANLVPSCFYLLGLRPEGADETPQLHQPGFDFPDGAIGLGVEMMCRLALR